MELQTAERSWREDPEDPEAAEAYARALERAGGVAPLDLREGVIWPERILERRPPFEIWARLPNGRELRLDSDEKTRVRLPRCRDWWLKARVRDRVELEALGVAARALAAPSLELGLFGLCLRDGLVSGLSRLRLFGRRAAKDALAGIEELSELRELQLGPVIGAPTLDRLAACPRLESLGLVSEEGRDPRWASLGGLSRLRALRLEPHLFHSASLRCLTRLSALERLVLGSSVAIPSNELDVESCRLLGGAPLRSLTIFRPNFVRGARLFGLERLAELVLPHGSGRHPEALAGFLRSSKLDRLVLRRGGCDDATLRALACSPRLRVLDLENSWGYTDRGVAALGLSSLRELRLGELDSYHQRYNELGPGCLPALAQVSSLRSLGLLGFGVEASTLDLLRPLAALRDLDLRGNPALGDEGCAALVAFPELRSLSLGPDTALSGQGLGALRFLEELTLIGCPKIDDAGLAAIAALPSLRVLRLRDASGVSPEGHRVLGEARGLEELEVLGKNQIIDSALEALAELPRLRSLTISSHRCSRAAREGFRQRSGPWLLPEVFVWPPS